MLWAMLTRHLAPFALLLLPTLAHAEPPVAPASAPPVAAPAAPTPAPSATPAKAAPVKAVKAAPVKATKPAGKGDKAAPAKAAAAPVKASRPLRAVERREQVKADVAGGKSIDIEISAQPQRPILEFVVEKAPVKFVLPELHPSQYDVPSGLAR